MVPKQIREHEDVTRPRFSQTSPSELVNEVSPSSHKLVPAVIWLI